MRILMLPSDRGIWRIEWPPAGSPFPEPDRPRTLDPDDFTVDIPDESIVAIAGRDERAWAVTAEGRSLEWEHAARMWRERQAWPSEELEVVCLASLPSGELLAGTVPAGVWRLDEDGWAELGRLDEMAAQNAWHGLEAPYEPRVTGLAPCPDSPDGVLAAVSVGGLVRFDGRAWQMADSGASDADSGLARDLRACAPDPWAAGAWLAGAGGLWRHRASAQPARRLALPPTAAYTFALAERRAPAQLACVAAPGPPQTWRGPEGARASVWSLEEPEGVGRPLAGPLHGVPSGLIFDGDSLLVPTDDGELWRVPLRGPRPEAPVLEDLPALRGIFLVDPGSAGR